MTVSLLPQVGQPRSWPGPEALAKRASAIQTHSSVLTENRSMSSKNSALVVFIRLDPLL